MPDDFVRIQDLLTHLYAAFNAREMDAVLAKMHPDVEWPNGWEGGWVQGREAVRAYWTRQWQAIDPTVMPTGFALESDGRVRVDVQQIVRDLAGKIVAEGAVQHVYRFADGLIAHMEIRH
jgi:ketosteroid isomerase-like protein